MYKGQIVMAMKNKKDKFEHAGRDRWKLLESIVKTRSRCVDSEWIFITLLHNFDEHGFRNETSDRNFGKGEKMAIGYLFFNISSNELWKILFFFGFLRKYS